MKPTQAVIDLSKQLSGLGVRKVIEYDDLYVHRGRISRHGAGALVPKDATPIWNNCDECIEWLRGKGYIVDVLQTMFLMSNFLWYVVGFHIAMPRPKSKPYSRLCWK